ncbi:hypothetical protein CDEF62S_00700 [Castellaniella defragrans]
MCMPMGNMRFYESVALRKECCDIRKGELLRRRSWRGDSAWLTRQCREQPDHTCAGSGLADRRSGGRARARHHHRRRLSVFRHAGAQVHHRRCAGPRTVHPQHGDGGVHGGCGHHPDRRRAGGGRAAADADQATRDAGAAAGPEAYRGGREQDGQGGLDEGDSGASRLLARRWRGISRSRRCNACRCRP